MDDLIGKLWEQSPLFLTRSEFAKTLEGWTFDPVYRDRETIGVFLVKGPEFHFAKFDDTPADKSILRKYPGDLIAKYGYAQTSTPKDDARQRRFNERLGFKVAGETQHDVIYRITESRIKENPCR